MIPSLLRERAPFALALVAASAIGPASVLHFLAREEAPFSPHAHILLVGLTALAAAIAAGALTYVGARRHDQRTVLVGVAFTTMTALLAVHGLATPGVLVENNGVVALAGGASLPVGGAILALAALPGLQRRGDVRPLLIGQAGLAAGILVLGVLAFVRPTLVPTVPTPGSGPAVGLLVTGIGFFGVLAFRGARTYALTRRSADLLVVVGTVWLGVALVPTLLQSVVALNFYIAHLLEILGVLLVGLQVAFDLFRSEPSRAMVGDCDAADVVASEEAFLGAQVRALMLALGTAFDPRCVDALHAVLRREYAEAARKVEHARRHRRRPPLPVGAASPLPKTAAASR